MSHELRTPLNSIIGFATLLKKRLQDEDEKLYIEKVQESSTQLLELINSILDLSKINSGMFTLYPEHKKIKEEIEHILSKNAILAQNKHINLIQNIDLQDACEAVADYKRIGQIITNLLSNAIKFTPERKSVTFEVRLENSSLIIDIKDEGIGISKEDQKRIFEAFEQVDNSSTRDYAGTGLGLNIVTSLIELMHGTLELESEVGKGSHFTITLPLQNISNHSKLSGKEEKQTQNFKKLEGNILIAEDNQTNQLLLKMMLVDFGITTASANDGIEAIEKFEKGHYAMILMDIDMPRMDGVKAMHKIREKNTHIPIVALTANAMIGDKEKYLQEGFDDYVSKPINDEVLYNTLKKYLKEA